MKINAKNSFIFNIFKNKDSIFFKISSMLLLSWFFAICSQIIIPLPFNLVPISLQPFPLFIFALIIGWTSVGSYFLCLLQAVFGAPFFSGFQGGLVKLLGPTGGFIFGFLIAMIFLVFIKDYKKHSHIVSFIKILCASVIYFLFGLFWLSFFVAPEALLSVGLIPFVYGDLLKVIVATFFVVRPNLR